MVLPLYLAMTAAEITAAEALPPHPAWMACHFSSYSTGLSNLPQQLPAGAMIVINDRIPVWKHDPQLILEQIQVLTEQLSPDAILLDFQRPKNTQTEQIAQTLCSALPCPVGVSEIYAKGLDCPVFLSAAPLHTPLQAQVDAWPSRELWVEAAFQAQRYTVTSTGCTWEDILPEDTDFTDEALCCSYRIRLQESKALFTLVRQEAGLTRFLNTVAQLGITKAIGLYQQLNSFFPDKA